MVIKFEDLANLPFSKKRYRTLIRTFCGKDICHISGWDEGTCDIHHIVPISEGGKQVFSNLIMISPNNHRLCHEGKYEVGELVKNKMKFFKKLFKKLSTPNNAYR